MIRILGVLISMIALLGCDIRVTEGEVVEVVGVVTDSKCPRINEYMCWGLDAYRNKHIRVKGIVSTYLVTDEMIMESTRNGLSYMDAREIKEIVKILEVLIVE